MPKPLAMKVLLKLLNALGLNAKQFSVGRLLGSWLGMALTPLWPMLKWTFSPLFPSGQMPGESISVSTLLQLNTLMQHLDAGTLLGRILPQLLLCFGVCILFSNAFGWAGSQVEARMKRVGA